MRGRWLTLTALGLAAGILLFGLGRLPLTQPDEGRNALVAAEMQASGRWLVPTLGQVDYLDKPAFYFKLVGFSLALFGQNEAAARLPSALAALLLVAITWAFGRRLFGVRAAALAAVALATTPLYVAFARLVIFDMVLTLFVCTSILAGYLAEASDGSVRRRWYLVGAAGAGLATLVKGPVGFLVPLLVHFAAAAVSGRRGVFRRALAPANIGVFVGLVLPWFVGVSLLAPDFPYYGIVQETFARFTSPKFQRNQPLWFYPAVLFFGVLPWTLLMPGAARAAWRLRARLGPAERLCLVWPIVVVLFFSLSRSKQPAYVLPVCVPLALLVGRVLDVALSRPSGLAARQVWWALGVLLPPFAIAVPVGWALLQNPAWMALLPGPGDTTGLLWEPFLPAVLAAAAAFCVAGLFAWIRRSVPLALACLAAIVPLLLATVMPALAQYADVRSSRGIAEQIALLPPDTEVACLRCFPSALPFYLGRPVTLVSADASELRSNYVLFAVGRSGALPAAVVHPDALQAWLAARRHPVYLLGGGQNRKSLVALAAERGVTMTELGPKLWAVLLPPLPQGS